MSYGIIFEWKSIRDFIHKGESIIMEKKHVVIGVSGGIAAYKACDLVSKLSKKDYEIKVVMTKICQTNQLWIFE